MASSVLESTTATTATIDGREYVAFAGCDYLGLSHHADVIAAAHGYGASLGSGASLQTSGRHVEHGLLEEELADFLDVDSVLLMPDGYVANIAALQGLAEQGFPVALHDSAAHVSLVDAARAARLRTASYGAGDAQLARVLAEAHAESGFLLLTDGAYPTQARLAPTEELFDIALDGYLVIDESHCLGVLGEGGRGMAAGLPGAHVVRTSSLGKALGGAGGFVAGSADAVEKVRTYGRAYGGSTAMPPAMACALRASLAILEAEPERPVRLAANAARLHALLDGHFGGETAPHLPVRALHVPDGYRLAADLREQGVFAPHTRYPGDPQGGVVRFAVCSEHGEREFETLAAALERLR